MVELDIDALHDAKKGLTICFIISITIANCILIYKKIREGQFLYTPRSLIKISLAIGDIFLALFALVVEARSLFETSSFENILLFESYSYASIIDCSTYKAFGTYLNFLIHFVYGLGLAVLAAELVQRHRKPQPAGNTSNNIIISVVYSACPWILGLIIILPLTMAGAYTEVFWYVGCAMNVTESRWQAMYVVSVILPAILAVLVCIAVMFINLSPPSPATVSYQGPTQGVVMNSHNTNVINAADPPPYPGSNAAAAQSYPITGTQASQQYPSNGIPGTALVPTAPANDKPDPNNGGTPSAQYPVQQDTAQQYPVQQNPVQQYPVQQYPGQHYPVQQYPGQQYPVQQYPAQQYPTPQHALQYPLPQYPVQQYTTQTNIPYTALTNIEYQQNTTAFPNPVKEKKALLIVAIIYFICVVPLAAFMMSISSLDSIPFASRVIIHDCLFWLSVSRSLITPIMFILVN